MVDYCLYEYKVGVVEEFDLADVHGLGPLRMSECPGREERDPVPSVRHTPSASGRPRCLPPPRSPR